MERVSWPAAAVAALGWFSQLYVIWHSLQPDQIQNENENENEKETEQEQEVEQETGRTAGSTGGHLGRWLGVGWLMTSSHRTANALGGQLNSILAHRKFIV